jgi:hypothetical protein
VVEPGAVVRGEDDDVAGDVEFGADEEFVVLRDDEDEDVVVADSGADPAVPGVEATSGESSAAAEDDDGAVPEVREDDDGGTGRPSRPTTTGEVASSSVADDEEASRVTGGSPLPAPETTGMARTSPTTVVVSTAAPASRPRRPPSSRVSWVRAPARRADSGGPDGRWCTSDLTGRLVTVRYRAETIGARKATDSAR